MYTLKGEIKIINEVQKVSDSFRKREFVVLDASGQYPQTILFQAVQERADLLNNFKAGDIVEVTFFLRGREWTNPKDGAVRFFNSLDVWKIEGDRNTAPASDNARVENTETFTQETEDDLPF